MARWGAGRGVLDTTPAPISSPLRCTRCRGPASRGGEGGEERAGRGSHHRKVSPHENSARSSTLPRPATSSPTPPNVTIPSNKAIPAAGALVEIRYLYAYKGGSLYQATYLNERDDIEAGDCVLGQLKYKAEGGEAEGEE